LTNFPREDQNREYLIVSAIHNLQSGQYESGAETGAGTTFSCNFTVIDSNQPYRHPRTTPKPVVQGPQTAIVVGPAGQEIHTDEYGRVKVQFHWDRHGQADENSSCWIRVSHPTAGKNWGAVAIPRIGQEVIVDFLEGDPDRPIITGRVYNADEMPPYDLPNNGMVSGMKSNSTPGGGGYNEISMNDTKGEENITIHAQYNMDTVVENDQSSTVHNNRTTTVDVDDSETVSNNQTLTVGSNQTVDVGSNQAITIGGERSVNVGSSDSLTVGSTRTMSVGGSESVTISGSRSMTVGGSEVVNVSGDQKTTATNINDTAGSNVTIMAGANAQVTGAANVTITAGSALTLTAGGSSITINAGGITLSTGGVITESASLLKHNV
jgi:type VI secretion system secreted protein VgrG